jgi:hypothetical protein
MIDVLRSLRLNLEGSPPARQSSFGKPDASKPMFRRRPEQAHTQFAGRYGQEYRHHAIEFNSRERHINVFKWI